jgi:4-diphosphocytidyl-2-C-methyl-D-erythritol kinase
MSRLRARCPAKVNLALHVRGRRPDGFHEIETLFQTIDLWDELEAEEADDLSIEASDPSLPGGDGNLVIRAARMLRERCAPERRLGASFRLAKSIPVGAGLGGGSSDAAGALILLNALWGLAQPRGALQRMASDLGSDVPFFLWGGTAAGTGRGEEIVPLPSFPERAILLGRPSYGLATADVYAALGAPLTAPVMDVTVPRLFLKLAEGKDFALARNDLESAAFGLRKELAEFRDALSRRGAELARLSGSGSVVFGIFRAEADAAAAADDLRGGFPGWTMRVTRTSTEGVRLVPVSQ